MVDSAQFWLSAQENSCKDKYKINADLFIDLYNGRRFSCLNCSVKSGIWSLCSLFIIPGQLSDVQHSAESTFNTFVATYTLYVTIVMYWKSGSAVSGSDWFCQIQHNNSDTEWIQKDESSWALSRTALSQSVKYFVQDTHSHWEKAVVTFFILWFVILIFDDLKRRDSLWPKPKVWKKEMSSLRQKNWISDLSTRQSPKITIIFANIEFF